MCNSVNVFFGLDCTVFFFSLLYSYLILAAS